MEDKIYVYEYSCWYYAAIAIFFLAGVWGFWVDHRKDKDLTDEASAAGNADTSSKKLNKVTRNAGTDIPAFS